jgi:hypothetical protein
LPVLDVDGDEIGSRPGNNRIPATGWTSGDEWRNRISTRRGRPPRLIFEYAHPWRPWHQNHLKCLMAGWEWRGGFRCLVEAAGCEFAHPSRCSSAGGGQILVTGGGRIYVVVARQSSPAVHSSRHPFVQSSLETVFYPQWKNHNSATTILKATESFDPLYVGVLCAMAYAQGAGVGSVRRGRSRCGTGTARPRCQGDAVSGRPTEKTPASHRRGMAGPFMEDVDK